MKEKHEWAVQIMEKLLECASTYEYDYSTGSQPETEQDIIRALIEGEDKGQKDQKADGTCLSPSFSSVLLQLIFLT